MIESHSVAAVRRARRPCRIPALAALLLLMVTATSFLHACTSRPDGARPTTPEATIPPGPEGELLRAAAVGDIFRVDELLNSGVDINARTNDGATALMGALYYRFPRTAELLIVRGADVNARSGRGLTALHQAAWEGYAEIAANLLRKGADANARTDDGTTPLMWAAMKGHDEVARVLVASGADVGATSGTGETAASLALKSGHPDVVRVLQAAEGRP